MVDHTYDVLVIEDEAILLEHITHVLQLSGYHVRTAHDAEHAIAELDRAAPDIVLVDLILPGQSGYAVLRHAQERYPELPVLVMTAYGSLTSAVEAIKQGAYDYLLKPISPHELQAALTRAANAVALQQSRMRAEQLRYITEVALTLAHEINNPLAVIAGELQLRKETDEPQEDERRMLEVCLEATQRIAKTIRRLTKMHEVVYLEYGGIRLIDLDTSVEGHQERALHE
jgi:DNA-binding response OmpR family regulator